MNRLLTILLATAVFSGCGERPTTRDATPPTASDTPATASSSPDSPADATGTVELTTEQMVFAEKWQAASTEERRTMADLAKVYPLFQSATKTQIQKVFGQATETGIDKFGEDVMRYELGDAPAADGGGKIHLTFVFEENGVAQVMGNFASFSQ